MEEHGIEIAERVPASRKLGETEARELIAAADTIRIAKGRNIERLAAGDDPDGVVAKLLGSTGNLRAPTIVVGSTLVVGYNDEIYREVFVENVKT